MNLNAGFSPPGAEDKWTDTTMTLSWEIEELNWTGGTNYRLNTFPGSFNALSTSTFCKNYMFSDGTPFDGNMYLYQKVN